MQPDKVSEKKAVKKAASISPMTKLLNDKLFAAVAQGNVKQAKILILCGADYRALDEYGNNLAHFACANGKIEMLEYLCCRPGFQPHAQNNKGNNYLHIAAARNQMEMVKYLVEKCNFDIGIKNYSGETAAKIADTKKNYNVSAYLAEKNVFRKQESDDIHYHKCEYSASYIHRRASSFNLLSIGSLEPIGSSREVKQSPETDLIDISLSLSEESVDGLWELEVSERNSLTQPTLISLDFLSGEPNRTALDLSNFQGPINEDFIIAIANKFPKLVSLNCSKCDSVNSACLMSIVSHMPKLTSLNLSNCKNVDDSALNVIAAGLPGITYLNLNNCNQLTDNAIESVAIKMTSLVKISLNNCNNITDMARTKLSNLFAHDVIISDSEEKYKTKSLETIAAGHANKVKKPCGGCHIM